MGKLAPRGQEMCDHYMAPPNQLAMACMQEIQHECFMMGIPLKTRHREVRSSQQRVAERYSALQCVTARYSALQRVAARCS